MVLNVSMLGLVEKKQLCLRSDAKVGDLICVTGDVGKSKAGLEMLLAGIKGDYPDHTSPKCRLNEARTISKYANAMIDVSDGIASEINHICNASDVGAEIFKEKIPLSNETIKLASICRNDPYDYALSGGEDYELLFTISKEGLTNIKLSTTITTIGQITLKETGVTLIDRQKTMPLKGGYNHFSKN